MIDNLLIRYKEVYSFKNLVYIHLNKRIIYPAVFIILLLSGLIIHFAMYFNMMWLNSLMSLPLFLFFPVLFYERRRIIKQVYQCEDMIALKTKLREDFKKRALLVEIDFKNNSQLAYLIEKMKSELKELKPKYYIQSGILFAAIAPVWIAYINKLFTVVKDESATYLALFIIVAVMSVAGLVHCFRIGIYNDIKYSRYNNLKAMLSIIEYYYIVSLNSKPELIL